MVQPHKRPIVLLALMAALGFAASATASSQTQFNTFFTKFKLERTSSGNREFKGAITSSKSNCVKGRKVKVIRKHNGNKKTLASDKTNDKGHFDVKLGSGKLKNGKYYAKATKKTFDNGKKTCLSATSGSIKVSNG